VISAYLEKTHPLPALYPEDPIPPVLDYLESQLPGDRDTVLARFSIADGG
jgi:glutathione S-transferase